MPETIAGQCIAVKQINSVNDNSPQAIAGEGFVLSIPEGYTAAVTTVGENIRRLMKARNMSGVELADKLGVRQPTAAKILKGKGTKPDTIARLAVIFECDVEEFFFGVSADYDRWRNTHTWQDVGRQDKMLAQQELIDLKNAATKAKVTSPDPAHVVQSSPDTSGGHYAARSDVPSPVESLPSDAEIVDVFVKSAVQLEKLSPLLRKISEAWATGEIRSDREQRSRSVGKAHATRRVGPRPRRGGKRSA
jgi:transcriptional regulator with XRE-family HTH domain